MQPVKNIIFDLGGIFLNIEFSNLYTQHHASNIFELLETGKIFPEEFHHAFVHETGVQLTYEQLVAAWSALLLDFPVNRLQWLKEIGKRYKIFLLSNTNKNAR